jgi:hypothetical protein
MTTTHVSGETVEDLARAFHEMLYTRDPDGSLTFEVTLDPEVALPLRRALMRTEADLLRQAADTLDNRPCWDELEQLQSDAFVELAVRFRQAIAS